MSGIIWELFHPSSFEKSLVNVEDGKTDDHDQRDDERELILLRCVCLLKEHGILLV